MKNQGQASEEQSNTGIASTIVLLLGISISALFLAVAGAEVLFRELLPGGPALSLYFIASVVFGVIVLLVSSVVWAIANKATLSRKREESGEKRAYSFAAIASLVSLISCIAVPLAPMFGAIGIRNIKRSGGRLSGMGSAHAGTVVGSAILMIVIIMKLNGYTTVKRNTEAAKETMRAIFAAENAFKTQLHLDEDGDGVGEYGPMSALHAKGYLRDIPGDEHGVREGYIFAIAPSSSDPETSFVGSGRPLLNWNSPGDRAPLLFTGDSWFYIDESGILWQNRSRGAKGSMTAAELATEGWMVVERLNR